MVLVRYLTAQCEDCKVTQCWHILQSSQVIVKNLYVLHASNQPHITYVHRHRVTESHKPATHHVCTPSSRHRKSQTSHTSRMYTVIASQKVTNQPHITYVHRHRVTESHKPATHHVCLDTRQCGVWAFAIWLSAELCIPRVIKISRHPRLTVSYLQYRLKFEK